MKRSTLKVSLEVVITFDREQMDEVSAAATFAASLQKGDLIPIPEGVKAKVTAEKPKLVNHSD